MQTPPLRVLPSQAILWEINGNGLERPSYIYAVLPRISSEFFFLPPGLNTLIEKSDKWMMEVNPSELDFDYLYRGEIPVDSTLGNMIPRKKYAELTRFVEDSLSTLARYKLNNRYAPALLAQQFISDYCLGFKLGDEPINYETYLFNVIPRNKPFQSLDIAWTRIFKEENYSLIDQTTFLLYTLENRKYFCDKFKQLQWAYRHGDLDQVWLQIKQLPELANQATSYPGARVDAWLKSIVWQMRYESLFMAIQAPLLPGEYGLLHQLRKLGFTVRPVSQP